MTQSKRCIRVSDLIRRTLAAEFLRNPRDPRFTTVTITTADIAPDFSQAKIYVTTLNDSERADVVAALNDEAAYYRHFLAKHLAIRRVPKLKFLVDDVEYQARRIADLLDDETE